MYLERVKFISPLLLFYFYSEVILKIKYTFCLILKFICEMVALLWVFKRSPLVLKITPTTASMYNVQVTSVSFALGEVPLSLLLP